MFNQRVPVMTRWERNRLAFLTSTHVVDDLYQGAVPALLPFLAIERHYSYAGLTGITLAATFLASVVQPGFGALTDKYRNLGWLVAAGLLARVRDFLRTRPETSRGEFTLPMVTVALRMRRR